MKKLRHEKMIRYLSEHGSLNVLLACELFHASEATVRRDFEQIAKMGIADRERGGLIMSSQRTGPSFPTRQVHHSDAKHAIAQTAVSLLQPGQVVFIDGGTTTAQIAACLPAIPLRIVTNSLVLAGLLDQRVGMRDRWEIFLIGGYLFPNSGLMVGPSALQGISLYHADWAMLSCGGINRTGVFNDNEHVVESEREMIARADHVAILADSSKLGRHAMRFIATLDEVDYLITDESDSQQLDELKIANPDLRIPKLNPSVANS